MTDNNISSPAIISNISKTPDAPTQTSTYNYGNGSGQTVDMMTTLDDPLPDFGKGRAFNYNIIVEQVGIKKRTPGGIYLPDESIDAEFWNHGIARIVSIGKTSFLGQFWRQFKTTFSNLEDVPKVGDVIMFQSKDGIRFKYDGHNLILLLDSSIKKIIDPEKVHLYKMG